MSACELPRLSSMYSSEIQIHAIFLMSFVILRWMREKSKVFKIFLPKVTFILMNLLRILYQLFLENGSLYIKWHMKNGGSLANFITLIEFETCDNVPLKQSWAQCIHWDEVRTTGRTCSVHIQMWQNFINGNVNVALCFDSEPTELYWGYRLLQIANLEFIREINWLVIFKIKFNNFTHFFPKKKCIHYFQLFSLYSDENFSCALWP